MSSDSATVVYLRAIFIEAQSQSIDLSLSYLGIFNGLLFNWRHLLWKLSQRRQQTLYFNDYWPELMAHARLVSTPSQFGGNSMGRSFVVGALTRQPNQRNVVTLRNGRHMIRLSSKRAPAIHYYLSLQRRANIIFFSKVKRVTSKKKWLRSFTWFHGGNDPMLFFFLTRVFSLSLLFPSPFSID